MHHSLEFPDVLRLIDERSPGFRAAVSAAPDPDAQVPTGPEWAMFNLAQHLGRGTWLATVAAGHAVTPRSPWMRDLVAPPEREVLLAWSAEAARQLGRRSGRWDRTADAGHRRGRRSLRRPEVPWPGTTYRKSRSIPMTRSSLSVRRKRCR